MHRPIRRAFKQIGSHAGVLWVPAGVPFYTITVRTRMPIAAYQGSPPNVLEIDAALFLWHQFVMRCHIRGVVSIGTLRVIRLRAYPLPEMLELHLEVGIF